MNKSIRTCLWMCLCLALCIPVGCQKQDGGRLIMVPEERDGSISLEDIGLTMDVVPLQSDPAVPLAEVTDICVSAGNLYVLDAMGTLSAFRLEDGRLLHRQANVGHGHGEYVNATAVCADGDSVYVLDFQGMKVLVYNDALAFSRQFPIDFPAMDFTAVGQGFLFYNMNADGNMGQIVHTTKSGSRVADFLSPEYTVDMMMTQHVFSESSDGVFISLPMSKQIYRWTGTEPVSDYTVHFGHADPKQKSSSDILEKSTETVIYSIVFHDAVMTFYLQERRVLCNHFNQKSNESLSGRVDTSSPYPFMFLLLAQHDNHLYTVVNPADVGASDNGDALVLLVFS